MPVTVTSKGRIKLKKDGLLISEHVQETEAFESAIRHAEANGSGLYTLEPPIKEIDVSVLARLVLATPPTSATATAVSSTQINVSWSAVVGAIEYRVYRNGALVDEPQGTTHSSTGLTPSTLYTFQIASVGPDVQEGLKGTPFSATTLAAPDTIPPSVPVISVTTLSSSSQQVSLTTASTDTGGSGLASYTLDRATNSGFTSNLVSTSIATTGFPVTINSLLPSAQYFYRCRAVDGASNTSANSATVNATTQSTPGNQAPVWSSSVDQTLSVGVPFSLNLDTLCTDPEAQPITYTITAGTLPAGLSQSGTRGEVISGTPTTAEAPSVTFQAFDGTGVSSMDTDFQARATAAGVTFATNFTDTYVNRVIVPARAIASTADLIAEAVDVGPNPENLSRDTTLKLSGQASLQIRVLPSSGSDSGAHWAYRPNGVDDTRFTRFYAQVAIYFTRESMAYRYQLDSASQPQQLKIWNWEQSASGQIAWTARYFLGFPNYFTQDGGGFNNSGDAQVPTGGPWGTTTAWREHIQNAISNANPASPTTKDDWIAKYGILPGVGAVDGDITYNASDPYLDDRTWPSGWPDTRAIAAGGVPFTMNGWTVLTGFVDYNTTTPSASTFMAWASAYGEAPRLIFRQIGNCPLGSNDVYRRLELLTYDTHRVSEVGRPVLPTNFAEPIVSTLPINHPGGFTLPGNLG